MIRVLFLPIGYGLDLLLGDPEGFPHPVVLMGKLIDFLERKFKVGPYSVNHRSTANREKEALKSANREKEALKSANRKGESLKEENREKENQRKEVFLGGLIWILTVAASGVIPFLILLFVGKISPWLGIAVESFMCYQILATKSLRDAAMKVYKDLIKGDLSAAKKNLALIVGRDVERLNEEGVTKAAVETVAENTSDGVVAPFLFTAVGGAPLGFVYKAINTMDSMMGYTDSPYSNIGFIPAKMDDAFNLIPARVGALLMLLAGKLLGFDGSYGFKIFKRDRYNHASPNSAQTEAACAGLLGLQLGGNAYYHGNLHEKPYIGDPIKTADAKDIPRACRILYGTSFLTLVLAVALRSLMVFL